MYNVLIMQVLQGKQDLSDDQRCSHLLKGSFIPNKREKVATCNKFGEDVAITQLVTSYITGGGGIGLTSYCWTE
jgi:hypothetical protein